MSLFLLISIFLTFSSYLRFVRANFSLLPNFFHFLHFISLPPFVCLNVSLSSLYVFLVHVRLCKCVFSLIFLSLLHLCYFLFLFCKFFHSSTPCLLLHPASICQHPLLSHLKTVHIAVFSFLSLPSTYTHLCSPLSLLPSFTVSPPRPFPFSLSFGLLAATLRPRASPSLLLMTLSSFPHTHSAICSSSLTIYFPFFSRLFFCSHTLTCLLKHVPALRPGTLERSSLPLLDCFMIALPGS